MAKKRRRKGPSCTFTPDVPGTKEASKLFIDLGALIKDRPLSNLVYVQYLLPGVADKMDALGFRRNKQGQHAARDVYEFLGGSQLKSLTDVASQAKAEKFMDDSNNLIDYSAEEAYNKAQLFNQSNKGRVAYVIQHGDKFNIIIDDKNSRTQSNEVNVNRALAEWNALKAELTANGIDVEALTKANPSIFNPGATSDFVRNLSILKVTPNENFSVKDIQTILLLNPNLPIVKNLMGRGWGTVEEVAQRIYDINHDILSNPPALINLVNNVLEQGKKTPLLNVQAIAKAVSVASSDFEKTDESYNIQKILNELDEKYHINSDTYVKIGNDINSMSDAYAEAAASLRRQIRVLERDKGKTDQSRDLRIIQEQLQKELMNKQYASGILSFMNTAVKYLAQVDTKLGGISATGTNLEYAHNIAEVTSQAKNLRDAYYKVVDAVASMSHILNDFSMTDSEKGEMQNLAKSLKEAFDNQGKKILELEREAMISVGKEFLGESNSLFGKDLSDIINMKEADATLTDFLYSIGRSSSTIISMAGAIIRDAQSNRDLQLAQIALRIRRATNELYAAGHDSSFMYDDHERIVSNILWDDYYKERARVRKGYIEFGLKGEELSQAMDEWEEENTELVEVDKVNHRFERLPKFVDPTNSYRDGWTDAQKKYYDTMMQIKAEIGTLLPDYAQHQYLAPQRRISTTHVLREAIQGKRSFDDVVRRIADKAKFWKLRPDDEKFQRNGIYINGEEATATIGDYDNTILREIPIFYIKKVDEGDLSHDFSGALQSLASTALNYNAMNNVKDLIELMNDYVARGTSLERDSNGRIRAEHIASSEYANIIVEMRKRAQDNKTSTILDSFVLKHIYGVENLNQGTFAHLTSKAIAYTSLRGLAVNVKGALTNKYMGVIQNFIRATGGQYYNISDFLKAYAILVGEQGESTLGGIVGGMVGGVPGALIGTAVGTVLGAKGMTAKALDIVTNNRNSKDTLIADFFDPAQENYSEFSNETYHTTMFGRLFGATNPMAMYSRGEYWIHMQNVYSILLHEKVIQYDPTTGKRRKISLYDALKKGEKIEGNSELKIADNIFTMDGKKLTDLTDDYFTGLKRRIRYINQQCHGSMNKEDKGTFHQMLLGKLSLNFRQWMIEHYSSRYRQLHWDESIRDVNLSNFYNHTKVKLNGKRVNLFDALEMVSDGSNGEFHYEIKQGATTTSGVKLTDDILNNMLNKYAEDSGWRRGFVNDLFVMLKGYLKERQDFETSTRLYWDSLSETQKADARMVLGESFTLLALWGADMCMGDPDRHKGEFFFRLWLYVVRRCLFDERASTIPGAIVEAKTIINNPIASTQSVAGLLYPILGLADINDTIKSGRYAGWNKYLRNVVKYTIPFYGQIDQLLNMGEDSSIFQTFENQITR